MQSIIDWVVQIIQTTPPWVVYLVVWSAVFAESAALLGLILPGETALLAGGVAAAVGETSIGWLVVGACVCAVCGDATGFVLGKWSGPRVMRSRLGRRIGPQRWDRVSAAVTHNGMVAVVGARWIGYVRTLTPFVAGMSRMPVRRYLTANVVGGLVWVNAVAFIGYAVGATVGARLLLYGGIVVAVIAVVVFTVNWLRGRRRAGITSDS